MQDYTLLTSGVRSPVFAGNEDGETEEVGHVALLDWDDHVGPERARELLDEHDVTGPTVFWRSSEGSWHGWNLEVRRFADTASLMDDLEDDGKHRSIGETRGWWRLRTGPKVYESGMTYKPAPKQVGYDLRSADGPISWPHLKLVAYLSDRPEYVDRMDDEYDLAGHSLLASQYVTFTDPEKQLHRQMVDNG
jgi:hypothetical protein